MKKSSKNFTKESLTKIFTNSESVLDIGGGLRVSKGKGNWQSSKSDWMLPLLEGIDYKIMDPVDTYNPDIVGDIHKMPFEDGGLEAIVCISVLEHVENPIQAAQEMHRTLKKGGYCFVYVPFLFYYHAEKGYYGDFWRFTPDSIKYIFKDFSHLEIVQARGALETWFKISPLGRSGLILGIGRLLDRILKKDTSKQTSGYYVMMMK